MSVSVLDEHPLHPTQVVPAPAARGERLMLAAIIERAVQDLRSARHRADALAWVEDDGDEPWTFRWVCEQLALHPETLRRIVRRRAERTAVVVTRAHNERVRLSA